MTIDLAHPAVSVEMLSRLLDQVASALMAVDGVGRVIVMNEEAQSILRTPADRCVGSSLDDDIEWTPEFRAMASALAACLATPRALRRQTATVGSGEDTRILGYAIAPLLGPDGHFEGAATVFTDITQVRALEEEQAETERFAHAGRVASWMAHEVKNPLATIQMYAQLYSLTPGQEQEDAVRVIREQVALAQSRISEMLRSLSWQSEERRELAVTDLGPALTDYLEREAPGLPHVSIEHSVGAGPHNVPIVPGDAVSVISNLVTNAAEALDGPGTIRVSLDSAGGTTTIAVEDSGAGFPDDEPQRLLRPFFTTKKRGTGLGLWVVKRIVEGARGRLSLENTNSGGARVTVRLPSLGIGDLVGRTVLVVDDDPGLRKILCRQLAMFGAATMEAGCGAEAADLLSKDAVDVVVTDINMPGGSGFELLREAPEHMPVLLVSGIVEPDAAVAGRAGVAFLQKPFTAEELGLALSYLIWETSVGR